MPIFQSDRGRLHYEELGAGRPILLIHGFTNYGLAWAPQLAALVHAGYRVILPDLHGHGASAPATSLCTVADLAADMVALLDTSPSAAQRCAASLSAGWSLSSLPLNGRTASLPLSWRTVAPRSSDLK